MRRWILVIVVVVFAAAVLGPLLLGFGVRAAPPNPNTAAVMQRKLLHAQKVLEGIALADLGKVNDHARELSALSRQAEFGVLKTPQYELCANDFRRALDDIQRGARQKNLDAATLGYVDLTMTCVRCHKHVRDVRVARND